MKTHISFIGILLILLTSEIGAQVPPQTVTFKVRKNQNETVPVRRVRYNEKTTEEGVWFVEENATFQGGDLKTFQTWVLKQIQYPAEAAEKGITGRVIIQFTVDKQGNVVNPNVIRSVHPSIDNEALRVISSSPKWQPAKESGKPVNQNYVIPLDFTLK